MIQLDEKEAGLLEGEVEASSTELELRGDRSLAGLADGRQRKRSTSPLVWLHKNRDSLPFLAGFAVVVGAFGLMAYSGFSGAISIAQSKGYSEKISAVIDSGSDGLPANTEVLGELTGKGGSIELRDPRTDELLRTIPVKVEARSTAAQEITYTVDSTLKDYSVDFQQSPGSEVSYSYDPRSDVLTKIAETEGSRGIL